MLQGGRRRHGTAPALLAPSLNCATKGRYLTGLTATRGSLRTRNHASHALGTTPTHLARVSCLVMHAWGPESEHVHSSALQFGSLLATCLSTGRYLITKASSPCRHVQMSGLPGRKFPRQEHQHTVRQRCMQSMHRQYLPNGQQQQVEGPGPAGRALLHAQVAHASLSCWQKISLHAKRCMTLATFSPCLQPNLPHVHCWT